MSTLTVPRHRKPGRPRLSSYPRNFRPKHCAGASCFHTHNPETRRRWCCPTLLDLPHAPGCIERRRQVGAA